jgi:NAD(P)-dependent dehydrogenase (short-subunit alcohol dehydrogenase family)
MDSAQKLVLVTGSSSGIGRALVDLLLRDDWHVVGLARRDPGIEHDRYTHHAADLSDLQSLPGLVDEAVGARLDGVERLGLVNNAALFGPLSWMRAVEATDPYVRRELGGPAVPDGPLREDPAGGLPAADRERVVGRGPFCLPRPG